MVRNSVNNSLKLPPFPCFFFQMVHKPIKLFAGVLWNVDNLKLGLVTMAAVGVAPRKSFVFTFAPIHFDI